MSHTVRTPALAGATATSVTRKPVQAPDELDDGLNISADALLEKLWRVATSMRTALVLMMGLAVLAFIGTMVVQAPSGMTSDRGAYAAWLDSVKPKYGGWTGLFDTLGFFSIFSSIWFKGIILALVTTISSCSVNRFKGLWKTAIKPRTKMTPVFYARAPHSEAVESTADPEGVLEGVRKAFGARHYRTVVERDGDTIHVYADKWRWAPFGTLFAHLSLILILVGALAGGTLGFRDTSFAVPVGSTVDVGNGTGLSVKALSFSDSYYTNGAPSDYASSLVVYQGGQQVAGQTIRVNQPLRVGDITFYQSFFGPAADMKVTDDAGKVLFESGVPLMFTSDNGNRRIGRMILDNPSLTIFVVEPASGQVDPEIKPGMAKLEVYQSASSTTPIDMQLVTQGQPVKVAGLNFTFQREQQFTGLIVARDPGQIFVWIGAMFLVGGLFLVFFFPNRRIWARIHPQGGGSEIQVGATTRHDATFGPDFQHLVRDMRIALGAPSAS
jgi:cytochrome c biogenesis protein